MPVNLSIKNVPDKWVKQLRARASQHHRSLQGELLSIIEESVSRGSKIKPRDLWGQLQQAGLNTPSESTKIIRQDRDGR